MSRDSITGEQNTIAESTGGELSADDRARLDARHAAWGLQ
jgi:hypothetical protein